jgi:chloramphenicol-sensitive protein RarD
MIKNNQRWTKGHSAGALAFFIWGLFPIYWKFFANLDALSLSIWRFIFTALTLGALVTLKSQWSELYKAMSELKTLLKLFVAGSLIASNWLIFMWAISHQLTWQSSLGYYISPLITVALGSFLLKEKLQWNTKWALYSASLGILLFLFHSKSLPLISLTLAITFSVYGYTKKSIRLPPHLSMTFETFLTLPLCFVYFFWIPHAGNQTLSTGLWFLLALSGILTVLPMFFYNYSAQHIPLNNLGMLQFISPTLQFCTAHFLFHEDIDTYKLYSFTFIWIAVLIYLFGPFIWNVFKVKKV